MFKFASNHIFSCRYRHRKEFRLFQLIIRLRFILDNAKMHGRQYFLELTSGFNLLFKLLVVYSYVQNTTENAFLFEKKIKCKILIKNAK